MLQRSSQLACVLLVAVPVFGAALGGTGRAAASAASTPRDEQSNPPFLELFPLAADGTLEEVNAARDDHATIALDIGRCYTGDPTTVLFELGEPLIHRFSSNREQAKVQELPTLNPFHAAAISSSDRVARNRIEFRKNFEAERSSSRLYQIVIVVLGACATFLVSWRSLIRGDNWKSGTIGVAAIIVSAAGTAVSSMNTVDGSEASAIRDRRALSQLQQLHWRIASDVLRRSDLCRAGDVPSGETMKEVDAWRVRLETILDSAVESLAKPGDLAGAGSTEDANFRTDRAPAPGGSIPIGQTAVGRQ